MYRKDFFSSPVPFSASSTTTKYNNFAASTIDTEFQKSDLKIVSLLEENMDENTLLSGGGKKAENQIGEMKTHNQTKITNQVPKPLSWIRPLWAQIKYVLE